MLITIVGNEGLCSLDSQYTKTCKLLRDSSSCDVDSHSHSGGNFTGHRSNIFIHLRIWWKPLPFWLPPLPKARPDTEADSRSKFSAGFPSLPVVPSLRQTFWMERRVKQTTDCAGETQMQPPKSPREQWNSRAPGGCLGNRRDANLCKWPFCFWNRCKHPYKNNQDSMERRPIFFSWLTYLIQKTHTRRCANKKALFRFHWLPKRS